MKKPHVRVNAETKRILDELKQMTGFSYSKLIGLALQLEKDHGPISAGFTPCKEPPLMQMPQRDCYMCHGDLKVLVNFVAVDCPNKIHNKEAEN